MTSEALELRLAIGSIYNTSLAVIIGPIGLCATGFTKDTDSAALMGYGYKSVGLIIVRCMHFLSRQQNPFTLDNDLRCTR